MKCLGPCKARLETNSITVFIWYQSNYDLGCFFLMASLSSSTSIIINIVASPSPTSLTTIHHLIIIKLTRDNYLLWKAQIVPYLKG